MTTSPHQLLSLHFRSLPSQIKLRWSRRTSYCFRRKICFVCSWGSQVPMQQRPGTAKAQPHPWPCKLPQLQGGQWVNPKGQSPRPSPSHPQERSSQDSAWQDEGITCTSLKTGLWEGYRSASLCAHTCKHKPWVSFALLDSFLLIFKPELAYLWPARSVVHFPHNSHHTKL